MKAKYIPGVNLISVDTELSHAFSNQAFGVTPNVKYENLEALCKPQNPEDRLTGLVFLKQKRAQSCKQDFKNQEWGGRIIHNSQGMEAT